VSTSLAVELQIIVLKDDINKLLLLISKLDHELFDIGLVRFDWLELVPDVVAVFHLVARFSHI
jgi:hypothetical protein